MVAVADADPAGASFFRHPHGNLIRLRTDHKAETVVTIDSCGARSRTQDFDLRCRIDEAFAEQIEIACQTRHAVGIDAAQVGGGEHVGSLRRVSFGHAEMQEDASAKLAQRFDGKYLGLYLGHAPPLPSLLRDSIPLTRAELALAFPRQRVSAASPRQKPAKSWPREFRASRSAEHPRQPKT